MFSTDFSRCPPPGQGEAVVIVEGRSVARRRDGVVWRRRVRDGTIHAEVLVFDDVDAARRVADEHPSRVRLLEAEARGYTNGVWRTEEPHAMANNEHFAPTSSEERAGRTPPEIAGRMRRPTSPGDRPGPRRWTIFDSESMFLGATRYRHPIAWAVVGRHWPRMVAKMRRMSGSVWIGTYWQWPFTLGTMATYRTRDDMLKFARLPEHRHLMQWIVRGTANATGGYIRLYASRAELDRRVRDAAPSHARSTGAPGGAGDPGPGDAAHAGRAATTPPVKATSLIERPEPLVLEVVETEAQFQEFLAVSRRGDPANLAVPLLESTARAWRADTAGAPEPVELILARRGDVAVGRTTIHTDHALDEKLATRATLFGATWAATPDDLAALLDAITARAHDAGATEAIGPAALLPNQTGGVITSGFGERGFLDSAWNPSWVPAVYEAAGFAAWNESDTWIAHPDEIDPSDTAVTPPTAAELDAAGIRIRRASVLRFGKQVEELRTLVNAAFARLPYYTDISPAQMRQATDGLVALMDPGLWLTAEDTRTGEPIGFALLVPDATEVLQRSGGRIGIREIITLLGARGRRGREAILIIQGVVPEQQGRGVATLLWRRLGAHLVAHGYGAVRSTFIGRDNPASARHLERLGGEPLHGTVFYRKRLDGTTQGSPT
ncbi:GNAT superfamily N-acetyltransferase [Pseudoclavibacter chungangensis]|uniref:GNAT family N-acetyltransferase n=1 Tax=Pseudoclavibacter chungangensis TaxID=587635 RepID=UPI0017CE9736|nr:GNAT family N-acetyltransferase [Pseudoclavibacter chungangensis]NYJ68532.1 GNAT superfamily N-acetyltransferase [Pseudoclavibacter chungangensis]